jgi:hypothetical protein
MAQGTDGYWYAYIGSDTEITAADNAHNNLDYGLEPSVATHHAVGLGQDHNGADGAGKLLEGLYEAKSIFLFTIRDLSFLDEAQELNKVM